MDDVTTSAEKVSYVRMFEKVRIRGMRGVRREAIRELMIVSSCR